jgi:hypothetical protein
MWTVGQPVYERRNQDSDLKESRGLHLSDPVGLKKPSKDCACRP